MEQAWQVGIGIARWGADLFVTRPIAWMARPIIGHYSEGTRQLLETAYSAAVAEIEAIERERGQRLLAPPSHQSELADLRNFARVFIDEGVTISGATLPVAELLLDYKGTGFYTVDDVGDPVCQVFTNGIDTDLCKARIAAAVRCKMTLDPDLREDQSHGAYRKNIADVLQALTPIDSTHKYTPYAVHDRRLMLNVKPEMVEVRLPVPGTANTEEHRVRNIAFRVKGTTDILVDASEPGASNPVFTSADKEVSPPSFGNVPLVIQVKKSKKNGRIPSYRKCMSQSVFELVVTDLKSDVPVLAVLTDLLDDWTFMWFTSVDGDRRRCNRIRFTEREEALTALASYLNSAEEDKLISVFNLAKFRDMGVEMTGAAFALPDEARPRSESSEEDEQD